MNPLLKKKIVIDLQQRVFNLRKKRSILIRFEYKLYNRREPYRIRDVEGDGTQTLNELKFCLLKPFQTLRRGGGDTHWKCCLATVAM